MSTDREIPPSIWSTTIDDRAAKSPDRVFCEILNKDWLTSGSKRITYSQLERAVNRLCWWLQEALGPANNFDPFVYVGDNDFRYALVMIAAQRSRRQVIIAELKRLTPAALLLLLEDTKCFQWLGGSPVQTALGETAASKRPGTKLRTLPSLDYWLNDVEAVHYPFDEEWDKAKKFPVFVIHSSGTTGNPKPLHYNLEMAAVGSNSRFLLDGTQENTQLMLARCHGKRILWAAPPQWLGGIIGYLNFSFYLDVVVIWPPVHDEVPTPAEIVARVIEKVQPDGGFYVPATLRDLCRKESSLELVKKHEFVIYGGAPLDEWVGDLLCTETELHIIVGSTETSLWPVRILEDRRDWKYYYFDPRLGHRLEHFQGDMYELVMDKKSEYGRFQGAFIMYPELDVWHTQDLYTPHPTKAGHFLYRGRKDDLLKLVWLTKIRASDLESSLTRNPKIASAMVGGEGKPTPFVIVELEKGHTVDEEELWSLVEDLNQTLSAEVRVPRKNVIISDTKKPLRRLGKGTLDRKRIILDYSDVLDTLYK